MDFSKLVSSICALRDSSIVRERSILRDLLESVPDSCLSSLVSILAGEGFGEGRSISTGGAKKSISSAFGFSIKQVESKLREEGNLPTAAEVMAREKTQENFRPGQRDAAFVFDELRIILEPSTGEKARLARLSSLLIDASPASAKVILELLLGQSSAYARRTVIIEGLALKFGVENRRIRELVDDKGWIAAVKRLLFGSSKGIIGRSGDGEERRKGCAQEGYTKRKS